ncbi:PEP-CTERM sorting domain-containing protein [Roseofilum casamattae]|uniref:PEP-CTERM sorting domain-containing protein n=1 Tax=Roseofilum casamattae BLCC-M143 TaxID=3022442 RepID=A0ABT7BXF6_9CYAN|nr:PEP-CTERM sorting domain-containing protein [Roseofilum casamattae]MDJ1183867.1 PEP-CTERM sorting domain-containing protein [Roseofilum casamattae BLCC-M143]
MGFISRKCEHYKVFKMCNTIQKITTAFTLTTLCCLGTAKSVRAANLVYNGDFSAGDTGFSSDYSSLNSHNLLPPPARYAVGKNPHDHHSLFSSFGDRTTGDGLMMIVNGGSLTDGAGPIVWSQTIDVLPDTSYDLSAWIASTIAAQTAQLQFAINSEAIGPVLTASTNISGFWENLSTTWHSGSHNSVQFSLINHNPVWTGNDFAVDDISFSAVPSVPEPSSIFALSIIAFGATLLRQRKQH